MSPLAKVFVVLITILSICFLGVSATLYGTQKNWKQVAESENAKRKSDVEKLKGEIDQLRGTLETTDSNFEATKRSLAVAETEREDLRTSSDDLKAQITRLTQEKNALQSQVSQKDQHLQEKDRDISNLTQSNEELRAQAAQSSERETEYKLLMSRAVLDKQEIEEQADSYRVELASLRKENDDYKLMWARLQDANVDLSTILEGQLAPPIDAQVVAVKPELDIALLSVGSDDKVEVGHEFTIYRGGDFVAKAKVIRVAPDAAGVRITLPAEGKRVQVGDDATTRLNF